MTLRYPLRLLLVPALGLLATLASAQNLVLNPSFESVLPGSAGGTPSNAIPTNWTQTQSLGIGCAFESLTSGQTPVNGLDFTIGSSGSNQAYLPTDGTHVLISDEEPSNVACQIFQDVFIPPGSPAQLTVAVGSVFRYNGGNNSTVTFAVTTPGGSPIATIYTRSSAAGANDPLIDRPTVDLSMFVGQTVRIIGSVTVPSSDWAGLQVDNVRLTGTPGSASATGIPTLGEVSLALCGLLLLGTGALYLRRRSR